MDMIELTVNINMQCQQLTYLTRVNTCAKLNIFSHDATCFLTRIYVTKEQMQTLLYNICLK